MSKPIVPKGARLPAALAGALIAGFGFYLGAFYLLRVHRVSPARARPVQVSTAPSAPFDDSPLATAIAFGAPPPRDPQARLDAELLGVMLRLSAQFDRTTPDQARRLIERGARVNARLPDGSTPLVMAAGEGSDLELVNFLISKGAGLNARGTAHYECSYRKDSTALMVAADRGWDELVDLLLDAGADVNARNKAGETALACAAGAFYEHDSGPKIIRTLLRHGARVNDRDKAGQTPLMKAAQGPHWGKDDAALVHTLLDAGADINARDEGGNTALMWSAAGPHYGDDDTEIPKALIDHGANVDKRNRKGKTALMIAVQSGAPRIAQLLIHRGAE